MSPLLRYLAKAEGTEIHFNEGEADITAPFGIYRHDHPDAEIFKFIDRVAQVNGIELPSSVWTSAAIDVMNMLLAERHPGIMEKLAEEFYSEFAKGAHLDRFPAKCVVSMFSMYTNSPRNAWQAVQATVNTMRTNNHINTDKLSEDGSYGPGTAKALGMATRAVDGNIFGELYFESLMLLNMSQIYARLAAKNPDKYLKYLNGWNNRLEHLSDI